MPLVAQRPYTYSPLIYAPDIRFVILHPAAFSSPIEISILQTSLTRRLPFEALSYTWGDESTLRPIAMFGVKRQVLHVTENLEAALRHLRYPNKTRLLWIDALCINQGDLEERSLQVMRMGDIFSRAVNVCIWLGEAANRSDDAMDFVEQVSHLGKLDRLIKDSSSVREWQALAMLMRRSWFSRRWVLQEVAYARKATVHCGTKRSKWSDFSDAVSLFGDKFDEVNLLFGPPHNQFDEAGNRFSLGNVRRVAAHALVTTLNHIIRKAADGRVIQRLCTMETLISDVALLQVTEPRDTVYAILTLAKDVRPLNEPIDYSKSVKQVCKDLVSHTVNSFGSLDIICRPWAPESPDLPSWIPKLSRHAFASGSDGRRVNGDSLVGSPTRPIYNASGKSRGARAIFSDQGNGFNLFVKGFRLATITVVEEPALNGVIPSSWMELGTRIAEEREKSERSATYTPEWNYVPEIFWRTLVADRGDDGNPPPGWYTRACEVAYRRCDFGTSEYGDLDTSRLLESPVDDGNSSTMASFLRRVQAVTWNRRLITTEYSYLGLAPLETQGDDIVCILFGCSVPVILREKEEGMTEFIGECYINGEEGVMDGQAADEAVFAGKYPIVDFKLK
jgi:hypothetical protein